MFYVLGRALLNWISALCAELFGIQMLDGCKGPVVWLLPKFWFLTFYLALVLVGLKNAIYEQFSFSPFLLYNSF